MNLFAAGWCLGLALTNVVYGNISVAILCAALACFNFVFVAMTRRS